MNVLEAVVAEVVAMGTVVIRKLAEGLPVAVEQTLLTDSALSSRQRTMMLTLRHRDLRQRRVPNRRRSIWKRTRTTIPHSDRTESLK
jgi:2-phosphoglycerate kinase